MENLSDDSEKYTKKDIDFELNKLSHKLNLDKFEKVIDIAPMDVEKYISKLSNILPTKNQAEKYFKDKKWPISEVQNIKWIEKWVHEFSECIDNVKILAPYLKKYIDYDELVALAYQETVFRSDAERRDIKWKPNIDLWYIQISPQNENGALKLLSNPIDFDLKTTNPQKYRTILGVLWMLNNKKHQISMEWRSKDQQARLWYYGHNAWNWQLQNALDFGKEIASSQWRWFVFSDFEKRALSYTWQWWLWFTDFSKREGKAISLYYQNLLKYSIGNISSIPVLENIWSKDVIQEWSKISTQKATISYNYMMYVDAMVRYLRSN